ncbi:hypothetical protein Tco_0223903 [Tanacetum coccineum]
MDFDKYLEGQSMKRPPLFESDCFIYWKNRFETYVKSKDLDLWHVITNGDFQPVQQNPETKLDEGRFTRQPWNDKKTFQIRRDDKNGKGDRKCFRCDDPNHLIGECLKPPKDKNQRAFCRSVLDDMVKKIDEKVIVETCNVIFGSNLHGNIIGKGQICDNKCRVTFSEHDNEITKDGKVIASKELVRNLPKLKFDQHFCDACKIGKQAHASHKAKNIVSTTRCLELLHIDLFGPSAVRSYGGNRYTLVIVDDYSSTHLGLRYPKRTGIETVVYADSDHEGDYVDRKSTSSICTFVGCCLTYWFSKKQTALAISTTKAKYVSVGKACQQALWMKQALIDFDIRLDDVLIMCDNKGVIDLSKNPVQYSRTKHIKIRHNFLRDNFQKGHISIEKVSSVDNIIDILKKLLKRESFNYLRLGLGMMEHIS